MIAALVIGFVMGALGMALAYEFFYDFSGETGDDQGP